MTLYSALNLLLTQQLTPLWTGVSPPVRCGIGWPPLDALQDVAKGNSSLGTLFPVGSENTTRWAGRTYAQAETITAAGLTATVSPALVLPGGTATITLGGTPGVNDAVVFAGSGPIAVAPTLADAIATTGESLSALATALAASINAAAGTLYTATASGAQVTVTNGYTVAANVAVNVGNIGTALRETRRVNRHVQLTFWTRDETTRQAVTDPVDSLLGTLEDFGFYYAGTTGASESVHVKYSSDHYSDEDQLRDVYRRDFHISLEHGVTVLDPLYPVLGVALTFTPAAANVGL